jgi:hypothetical protein
MGELGERKEILLFTPIVYWEKPSKYLLSLRLHLSGSELGGASGSRWPPLRPVLLSSATGASAQTARAGFPILLPPNQTRLRRLKMNQFLPNCIIYTMVVRGALFVVFRCVRIRAILRVPISATRYSRFWLLRAAHAPRQLDRSLL